MLYLRALLLWGLVSVHIVGAAFLFRRLFPRESRWLAFVVPPIVVVFICNFVEHHLALTALGFALPLTTIGSVAAIAGAKSPRRTMRLPTCLFLGAFAFSLGVRLLRPDMEDSIGYDGIYDLSLISHFLFGQTLPVESTWLPPVKLLYYYCLEHYGASVLIRLLGVDAGTGWNLCTALLSAYVYFLAGAAAWHLGRGKLWIATLAPVLTACAATGTSGYLWLTMRDLVPINIINLATLYYDPATRGNWLLQHLTPVFEKHAPTLYPPGVGVWIGDFHSMNAGQFVICFAVLALIELLRRKRSNWPWICLAISPFLMLTTCTWGLPMNLFLLVAGLIACARAKIAPANLSFVLATSAGLIALLEPMLGYFLQAGSPPINWVPSSERTQGLEFLAQWWPVFLPGLALCCIWRRVSPATRIVLVMTPLLSPAWKC